MAAPPPSCIFRVHKGHRTPSPQVPTARASLWGGVCPVSAYCTHGPSRTTNWRRWAKGTKPFLRRFALSLRGSNKAAGSGLGTHLQARQPRRPWVPQAPAAPPPPRPPMSAHGRRPVVSPALCLSPSLSFEKAGNNVKLCLQCCFPKRESTCLILPPSPGNPRAVVSQQVGGQQDWGSPKGPVLAPKVKQFKNPTAQSSPI